MPDKILGFGGVLRAQAEGMVFILCVWLGQEFFEILLLN